VKWLIGLIVLAQVPFLFIAFVAAGTDGKASSLLKVWAIVIPIFVSGIFALYRHFSRSQLTSVDWVVTVVACSPVIYLMVFGLRTLLIGS
jgi:hypothetical protein